MNHELKISNFSTIAKARADRQFPVNFLILDSLFLVDKDSQIIDTILLIIKDLFKKMGFEISEISTETLKSDSEEKEEGVLLFKILSPDDCSLLLGKRGENLKSLEHIIRVLSMKKFDEKILIAIDLNDYKRERFNRVLKIAQEVAEKVKITQKAEALLPMSAYERRLIHVELAAYKDVATESIGEEPKRRVVIRPYP